GLSHSGVYVLKNGTEPGGHAAGAVTSWVIKGSPVIGALRQISRVGSILGLSPVGAPVIVFRQGRHSLRSINCGLVRRVTGVPAGSPRRLITEIPHVGQSLTRPS